MLPIPNGCQVLHERLAFGDANANGTSRQFGESFRILPAGEGFLGDCDHVGLAWRDAVSVYIPVVDVLTLRMRKMLTVGVHADGLAGYSNTDVSGSGRPRSEPTAPLRRVPES